MRLEAAPRGGSRKVHGGNRNRMYGFEVVRVGRVGGSRKVGGRSGRKVHGGMGAALLSENRVRRGGQMFQLFGARFGALGGGRSRKVGGGSRKVGGGRSRKVRGGSGRMHVVVFGGRSGRKLHGRSRKLQGGRRIILAHDAFGF